MITKAEAVEAGEVWSRVEFHYAPACTPRRVEKWRANGKCKVWKTRPDEFSLPIKFGLRTYAYLTHLNAEHFHFAVDCPLQATSTANPPTNLPHNNTDRTTTSKGAK